MCDSTYVGQTKHNSHGNKTMDYTKSIIIGIVLECEAGFINCFEMEELAEDQIEAYTDDPDEYLELYSCLNSERLARGV